MTYLSSIPTEIFTAIWLTALSFTLGFTSVMTFSAWRDYRKLMSITSEEVKELYRRDIYIWLVIDVTLLVIIGYTIY